MAPRAPARGFRESLIGVVVVVLGGDPSMSGDQLGVILSVATMVTFVAYHLVTTFARSTTNVGAFEWMTGVSLFAAATVTPFALVGAAGEYGQLAGLDWVYMAYVVVAVGIAGHTLMSWTQRFLDASRSSLYLLCMNPVAVVAAWPINHDG
jgi:drug/metabolite transporter (DMT)-like permease